MYTVKPVLATISPPGLNPPTHFAISFYSGQIQRRKELCSKWIQPVLENSPDELP